MHPFSFARAFVNHSLIFRRSGLVALLLMAAVMPVALTNLASADDWPQWMGPKRDGVWRETGLVEKFPADGLQVKWRKPIAGGYAGPAVADGAVYVTDFKVSSGKGTNSPGKRDKLSGKERVLCLDANTGVEKWSFAYDVNYEVSYPVGPRCTPVVDAGKVYVLGTMGHLHCLDADNGEVVWKHLLTEKYDCDVPIWGFSGHPLVDGDRLVCLVGGKGSVAVAFNKHTGTEVWKNLSASDIGYCPPTMIEHAGKRQLLIWDADKLSALNPADGQPIWSEPLKPDYAMSIMAPQKSGDLIFAGGIGNVSATFQLNADGTDTEVLWRGEAKNSLYAANATPLIADGVIYGCDCRPGAFRAVKLETGERLWETYKPTTNNRRSAHATAFLVKHPPSDTYFLFSEIGDLIRAKLTPEKYTELDRFHVLEPTSTAFGREVVWSHPAFANRCVFARNDKEIVCVSLSAE